MGSIELNEMKFYAHHGVDATEQKLGRDYLVSVNFDFDFEKAAIEAKLDETADYARVYEITKAEMNVPEKLLETVSRRIAWRIKNEFVKAKNIEVSIKKLAPFVGGEALFAKVTYRIK